MSFFCGPMRLRTKKKRDGDESLLPYDSAPMSAPIRIPNDPASKMTVLNDFIASLKDELTVRKGETVDILDVDRKWAFVAAGSGRGFVPLSCLGPHPVRARSTVIASSTLQSQNEDNVGSVSVFTKDPCGHYVALYDFMAQDEDDLSVVCGECVISLNEEDPDWAWVQKSNGDEGFVPRSYLYSDSVSSTNDVSISADGMMMSSDSDLHKLQLCGTELMSLYDYQGRIAEDLSVLRGDLLYADMTNQTHDEWLWAYCPRTQSCGFIPKDYARPPALE
ncbi:SH3 domain-containing protein Dlish-like [Asterias rubens]|uniref:SH3 domain-containing protein Dlish-like n=1 Tax=Asterias rubens TaxID=7604 RepID=UPI0014555643|nr:SH3 domain-containing protein Dlish-like [Asterias rubens]